jgi:hypothetical protein
MIMMMMMEKRNKNFQNFPNGNPHLLLEGIKERRK